MYEEVLNIKDLKLCSIVLMDATDCFNFDIKIKFNIKLKIIIKHGRWKMSI